MSEFQPIEKTCKVSGKKFTVYPEDQEFYARKGVPLPTLSPHERARRKYAFINNELALYRRKCDATGKDLITFYHPETPIKVYDRDYWQSDEFDPFKYGRDFDFSKSFFEQIHDLYWTVPTFHTAGVNNENGDYVTYGRNNKDCYLVGGHNSVNCMYGVFMGGINSLDCYMSFESEECYECLNCANCYEVFYSMHCQNCRGSRFLYDCVDCRDCIMCFGLRHKSYCIKNKQLSKEEYEREKKEYELGSYENLKELKSVYQDFLRGFPVRENNNVNCDNCVGDFLRDAKNCFMCFNGTGSRESRYCMPYANQTTSSYDTCASYSEGCLEVGASNAINNCMFCKGVWDGSEIYYSLDIINQSHDLFGCVGLKGNNEYCILNRQYGKGEYFDLCNRIIEYMKGTGEWGEYFPMWMSMFPYYDGYTYFGWPIEDKKVEYIDQNKGLAQVDLAGGGKVKLHWRPRLEFDKGESTSYQVSDNVQEYAGEQQQKELLNAVLVCKVTGRKYRIQSRELYFYLKHNIAIPRESYYARHPRKIKQMMRFDIRSSDCDKCGRQIQTVYDKSIDGREVWCEECYRRAISN